ncbi:DUF4919 domain-containing protein [Chryseobacterium sp. GMJ5]|uniref:DUF4919 domain-containing protein n=1 Tax=Chryseobacterium gilvum TaxID=2976534 RepID=A0ABT2VWR5_9FLAO|nr:DUF4919 domain-containing protein [Chryseobacterium gilvum]MCU7614437.1 DUF4919 domain-containing protein [Chryseobacterium gilvum]
MKKLLLLFFLFSIGIYYPQVNIEQIKKDVTDNPQKFYYDNLEIFKTNPKLLNQEQLNYIYYGNNYVDYGFKRAEFNDNLNKITDFSNRNISFKKASEVLEKAKILYQKNPLSKELLLDLQKLYLKVKNEEKADFHFSQYWLLYQTIINSGTGKLDVSPLAVTNFSDQIIALESSKVFVRGLTFTTKVLPDGSWLNIYKNGQDLFFIIMFHHKDFYKDDK